MLDTFQLRSNRLSYTTMVFTGPLTLVHILLFTSPRFNALMLSMPGTRTQLQVIKLLKKRGGELYDENHASKTHGSTGRYRLV